MKKRYIFGSLCVVALTAALMFSLLAIPKLVEELVLKSVALDPEKIETWGQNPGRSNTLTLRNFTFYNFTNPRKYAYRNQTPRFHQTTGFLLQQATNFTKINYFEDKSKINFSIWLHFATLNNSRSLQQQVNILNLGPLGYWDQSENSDIANVAIRGFGGNFYELNNSLKIQAIGKGISSQYLKDLLSLNSSLCMKMFLPAQGCQMFWSDPAFGLNDDQNYKLWINWVFYNNVEDGAKIVEYFGWNRLQTQIFRSTFYQWCQSMSYILENWYCEGRACSSYEMMLKQFSEARITKNPPSGEPQPSICLTGNLTCEGWPELYSYYHYGFLPKNREARFQNLTFQLDLVQKLFTPYTGLFLNVGNLSSAFKCGQKYDQNKNQQNQEILKKCFLAKNKQQAIVLWQYLKYYVFEFITKRSQNGQRKLSALALTHVTYLYRTFNQYYEWLPRELISLLTAEQMGNCTQFISQVVEGIQSKKLQVICRDVSKQNYRQYYRIVQPCINHLSSQKKLKFDFKLTNLEVQQYCDQQNLSVKTLLDKVNLRLAKHYSCTQNKMVVKCSFLELTLKQFFESAITLNPIATSIKNYTSSYTGHDWNPALGEWEYRHFLKEVYDDPYYDSQKFTYSEMADLLSFDKLFSNPMTIKIFLQKNQSRFQEVYFWKNRSLLQQWVRFFTIQVAFGGLTQKRKVKDLMFGYEDPFIKDLKELDLMRGGDPSLQTKLSICQANQSLEEAQTRTSSMYTGYKDPYTTRNFITKDGEESIFFTKRSFNGYEVITQNQSPYKQAVPLKGTDGTQNKPLTRPTDLLYVYVDQLKRVSEMGFQQQLQRFGFTAYRFALTQKAIASSRKQPENDIYYQQYGGMLNVSYRGTPIFVSGNHFSRTDPEDNWPNKVQMFDQSGTQRQNASQFDRSQLIIQPNSGATFTATTYLQSNILFKTDILFRGQLAMLPVFTIYRSGNMSESAADQILGTLKIGLKAPKFLGISFGIGVFLVLISMIICFLRERNPKRTLEPGSLLQSLNEEIDQGKNQALKNQINQLQSHEKQVVSIQAQKIEAQNTDNQRKLNETIQIEA